MRLSIRKRMSMAMALLTFWTSSLSHKIWVNRQRLRLSNVAVIETLELDAAMVQAWIAAAAAKNDGSIAFRQGIENLERLLASLLPEKTALLPNYPNPFNPETWIPYDLAEAADVTVHIYAADGALIRTLALGHQVAGIYQSRARAA